MHIGRDVVRSCCASIAVGTPGSEARVMRRRQCVGTSLSNVIAPMVTEPRCQSFEGGNVAQKIRLGTAPVGIPLIQLNALDHWPPASTPNAPLVGDFQSRTIGVSVPSDDRKRHRYLSLPLNTSHDGSRSRPTRKCRGQSKMAGTVRSFAVTRNSGIAWARHRRS